MQKLLLIVLSAFVSISTFAQDDLKLQLAKFERFLTLTDKLYVDSTDNNQLVEAAIKTTLKQLDPHSVYIPAKDLKKMNEPLEGKFDGVGIQFNIHEDTILVVAAISGGPSEKLGIQAGDKIVTIDDSTVAGIGFTNQDVISNLRGKKGTKVKVGIKREGYGELLDFEITRDKIPIFSVDATYMLNDETGYIKLNRFAATSMGEIQKGMEELKAAGMEKLVLDLRGNSGGYLRTAHALADEFLDDGKLIVYTEGRAFPKDEKKATSRGNFEKGKLVILIDQGSASASEIVSGAVQDWDRGLIVGRRSFGKGLVQKPYSLPDGSAMRLTISRYYTPTGRSIQRPYDDGKTAYYKEIRDRFKDGGEVWTQNADEIPDSLKFYTPKKRMVFGGGGIFPDVFVPIDTTDVSPFYTSIRRKGVMNQYILKDLSKNRQAYQEQYPTLADFKANFDMASQMEGFYDFAETKDVERDSAGIERSGKLLEIQTKALLARNLFDNSAYYEVYNDRDPVVKKAMEVLNDKTFEKLKLAYK